jgi:hypothetical protein
MFLTNHIAVFDTDVPSTGHGISAWSNHTAEDIHTNDHKLYLLYHYTSAKN